MPINIVYGDFCLSVMGQVTKEEISRFLSGSDPMEHIIKIECDYEDKYAYIIYVNQDGKKVVKKDKFYPFLWAKASAASTLYKGDKKKLVGEMNNLGIICRGLRQNDDESVIPLRMKRGYYILFEAKSPMSYKRFLEFFSKGGVPVYSHDDEEKENGYITVAPIEQYMIKTGKRLFKGYEDYDDLVRMQWDLETEGLNPTIHSINQIGIRTNKGYEKIISITGAGEERALSELKAIKEFFVIINTIKPDIISGHNTENFDWNFIKARLEHYGSNLLEYSCPPLPKGVYKKTKQAVLKLGGEMEYYYPTVMWGYNLTDSLFAVRRAQALDSNMKKADLKYVTKYSKMVKPNRVYIPGKLISKTWEDKTLTYAFNEANGNWFKITNSILSKTYTDHNVEIAKYIVDNDTIRDNQNNEIFKIVTGKYIAERYLLDDLYETDKVENRYNQSNFLLGKMLPVSYEKMCTMGTAAIWRYIMLAWSYEHGLAIPDLVQSHSFTGGLSRLLKVGFVDNVVKLDYNSLYPSIILTFNIKSDIDIQGVMNALLEYMLTQRELYKRLKVEEGKKAKAAKNEEEKLKHEALVAKYDKMQLPLKITGNAFFGSYGSGSIFPWSDITCAEETTCTGRMMLRLMIKHFTDLGYMPIVGDSFTGDTPVFIKYNNGLVDIVPIESIFSKQNASTDALEREYDMSIKNYRVLCRSGWVEPSYIYRHKTNKDIYRISDDGKLCVDITEDHSIYDEDKKAIKPSQVTNKTRLEFYNEKIISNVYDMTDNVHDIINKIKSSPPMTKLPIEWMNANERSKRLFISEISKMALPKGLTKTLLAGINYIKDCVI